MPPPNKFDIARTFSAAAARYDAAADLQRQVGHRLLALLQQYYPHSLAGQTIADIGAGSGYFCRLLAQQHAQVLALDLAIGMLRYTAQHSTAYCILADAEQLPLANASVNGCFSSLAVQWCDLTQAIHEMQRITHATGWLAIATLMEGSLWQLKQAWQAADNTPHVNTFLCPQQLAHATQQLSHVHIHDETITQSFPDLSTLLHSLKHIGANHVAGRANGLMGKQRWQRFVQAYQALRLANGDFPLDYRVAYIIATPNTVHKKTR